MCRVYSADIYTMTGPCLELLFSQLELLKQSADTGSLLPREELIYAHTVQVVESLIAQVFECYFTAGDAQGVGGMGQEGESQAAVLRPAVELFKRALGGRHRFGRGGGIVLLVVYFLYRHSFGKYAVWTTVSLQCSRTATTRLIVSGCATASALQRTASTTSSRSMQSRSRACWQTATQVPPHTHTMHSV